MNRPDDVDSLISRVVDGQSGGAAWDELVMTAQADPQLWRALAEAQHDQTVLARGVEEAIAVAEAVEAPPAVPEGADDGAPVIARIGSWSGWAVAALVCLVWATVAPRATAPSGEAGIIPAQANVMPVSAAEAFQAYLDKGRQERWVIGEMPTRVLVESWPVVGGDGYEVLYLRQVLERTVVPDLYRFDGRDERGVATLVRLEHVTRDSM